MEGVINGKTRICNAGKGRHDERKATVEWETRQLGIMDWITNDGRLDDRRMASGKQKTCVA